LFNEAAKAASFSATFEAIESGLTTNTSSVRLADECFDSLPPFLKGQDLIAVNGDGFVTLSGSVAMAFEDGS
jgi:hypothetical protein